MTFEEGPYVNLACIAQHVIMSREGDLSIIGNFDHLTHKIQDASEKGTGFSEKFELVIAMITGNAIGLHEMTIIPELPSGKTKRPLKRKFSLEDHCLGINFDINTHFTFTEEGCYWFNVYLDNKLLTKIPLNIEYELVKKRTRKKVEQLPTNMITNNT